MKKITNAILALLLAAGALTSCSDEALLSEGQGTLNFNVAIDGEPEVVTRASNEASLAENCIVYVYNSKGLIRKYRGTNTLPEKIYLASGNYRVTAAAGDSVAASFTDRYFKGASDFTISAGNETTATVNCKIVNSVVLVDFGNASEALDNYKITVSNGGGSLEYTSDMAGTKGYFMLDDGETSLSWTLTGKQKDGSDYEQSGTISGVKATTQYTLKVNYTEPSTSFGGVMFDIDIEEEEIVTAQVVITAAPKFMLNGGRRVDEPVVGEPAKFTSSLGVYCTAACALKSIEVSGDVLTSKLGLPDNQFELFAMTEAYRSNLEALGVTYSYEYNAEEDNAIAKILFDKDLLNKLEVGTYTINFVATDVKNKVRNYTMTIDITDASVATVTIVEDNVYTSKATIYGNVLKENLSGLSFRYRKSGDSEWITVSATVDGNSMSAELTGLSAGTTYEYQAICDGFTVAEVKTFTTEIAAQLPNAGFEDWQTSSSPYLVYPAGGEMFWDTGNHGSSTMNKNVTVPSTTIKQSGTYSIDLKSQFVGLGSIGKFAAGNVFVGKYIRTDGTDGVLGWGRPFASRPAKLTGYVKYTPSTINYNSGVVDGATGTDKGVIFVVLWDDSKETDSTSGESWPFIVKTKTSERHLLDTTSSHIIGYGAIEFTEATEGEGMVKFEVNIDYRSNKKPSAIILTASASKYGDYFCGGSGSEMWLDDLELVYE